MKRFVLYVVFLLLFGHSSAYGISGISNGYGKFVAVKTANEYTVTFVLNPASKKFENIKEVTMTDYGNDGEGNVSVVLYRKGNKEVFFRTVNDYRRFARKDASADVCRGEWSKIVYRKDFNRWECSEINFFKSLYLWWEIDEGLFEAGKNDWYALAERLKKVEAFIK